MPQQQQYTVQDNMNARLAVVNRAVNMIQAIYTKSDSGANLAGNVYNIPVRNVGLIKRFIVKIEADVVRSAAETHTATPYAGANILSSIIFTDLSNQNRVQTAGWHLYNLATVSPRRNKKAWGAAFTNDSPVDMGSNFTVLNTPSPLTTVQTLTQYFEVPISYSDFDLRGAIFASVVNATMNLQLTLNANFSVVSGADPTLAVYTSSSTDLAVITDVTITVYQEYLDQLPQAQGGGPVLPLFDLGTSYNINNTVATGLAASQDLTIPYANFRDFMSTFIIYDNGGTLNTGSDINNLRLQSANFTNIFNYDPITSALLTREIVNDDFPDGTYYFDHRRKPVNTIQYGNMELVVNPSTVNANAQVLVGYEALALINQVAQAGSLYNT